jgi:hypothetical protein
MAGGFWGEEERMCDETSIDDSNRWRPIAVKQKSAEMEWTSPSLRGIRHD